jgi:hypothetical protein
MADVHAQWQAMPSFCSQAGVLLCFSKASSAVEVLLS